MGRSRAATAVAIVGLSGVPAEAADGGWYVGIDGLAAISRFDDASTSGVPGTVGNVEDDDFVVGVLAQLGRDFGRVRAEVEVGWRYRFDYNSDVVAGAARTRIKNDVETRSAMANLRWDVTDWSTAWGTVTPYVGAGLGYVENRSEVERIALNTATRTERDQTESGLAWSLAAGARWWPADGWGLEVGYRFSYLGEVSSGRFADGLEQSADAYWSHDFTLGVRYRF